MSEQENLVQRANAFLLLRQRPGAFLLIIGGVLALLGLFWFPYESDFIIRGSDNLVIGRAQSLTQWQYPLSWTSFIDARVYFLTPFALVALITVLALLFGVSEAFGIFKAFNRVGRRFKRLSLALLILALLAQCFFALMTTFKIMYYNPCLHVICGGMYMEWRGDFGIGFSLVGLGCLLVGRRPALLEEKEHD